MPPLLIFWLILVWLFFSVMVHDYFIFEERAGNLKKCGWKHFLISIIPLYHIWLFIKFEKDMW